MKVQYIAIIFIIIMIPLMLVLTVYTQSQIDNLGVQLQYDTKLYDATYDGMKAFQLNTVNNKYSQVADSLKRDVEAAIKTFITSLSNNLSLSGYSIKDVSPYIPSILFTLYDGYYIYAPTYAEKLQEVEKDSIDVDGNPVKIIKEESKTPIEYSYENILKPYIYYTVKYHKNENNDFIVNYTLDNYIILYGMVNGQYVTKSGFLIVPGKVKLEIDKLKLETILKRNILEYILPLRTLDNADQETILTLYDRAPLGNLRPIDKVSLTSNFGEKLLNRLLTTKTLATVNDDVLLEEMLDSKIDEFLEDDDEIIGENYIITDDGIIDEVIDVFKINYDGIEISDSSAKKYYVKALRFTNWINKNLPDIKVSDAIKIDGSQYEEFKDNNSYLFNTINGNDPEDLSSTFSQHRMLAIRISIQTNLNTAIAKYNERFFEEKTYNLKMPLMNDNEWEKITNHISMATFFQGLQIGNKVYNNYTVVASTENKEMISNDNMYYFKKDLTGTVYYHKIDCPNLEDDGEIIGAKNIDYDVYKSRNEDETYEYTFGDIIEGVRLKGRPQNNIKQVGDITELSACYDCIINQNYIPKITLNANRLKAKYTTIGRERNNLYKVNEYINM